MDKQCPNIFDRYFYSWIEVEDILENETSSSETKSRVTEEKQRRLVIDSLIKLKLVEVSSVHSKVLDVASWTNENTNDSKHVDDDKNFSEEHTPIQKQSV